MAAEPTTTPEPPVASIPLSLGGDLSIGLTADGTYRMTVDTDGVHLSVPLSPRDVQGIRMLTGDLTLGHLRAVAP